MGGHGLAPLGSYGLFSRFCGQYQRILPWANSDAPLKEDMRVAEVPGSIHVVIDFTTLEVGSPLNEVLGHDHHRRLILAEVSGWRVRIPSVGGHPRGVRRGGNRSRHLGDGDYSRAIDDFVRAGVCGEI